ncbi:MAG: hypothetical protein ACR2L4_09360, partial [Actinomycetota bacterium]
TPPPHGCCAPPAPPPRDPDAVAIAVYVRASFAARADEALLAAGAEYASYPAYARQFEVMGVELSPEAVVDAVCLRGDPALARERLDRYRHAGAGLPVVYPVLAPGEGGDEALTVLRTLSP